MVTDPYTGDMEPDYTGLWLKQDAIRMALSESDRALFDQRTGKNRTSLEDTFKYAYTKYIRGYKMSSRIVFNELNDKEKAIVREYNADGTTKARKEELKEMTNSEGLKIISQYNSALADIHKSVRQASPTTDFWLYVFGYGVEAQETPAARKMVDAFDKDRTSILKYTLD